ncbi:SDR family oxidoreductase [Streptomyces sp. NPDC058740]|uniref:SDR family oxidoreductase n=1 Tax=unclassified Streptomyces TaxID=2593676 RepID=UPI003673800F
MHAAPALRDAAVVVTGASSGIGRVTATEFARHGARVVLAARSADALEEVARECRRRGGEALVVVTDVTDERAVEALADRAVGRFGRIDVWVNAAGVGILGRVDQVPGPELRRLLDVNVLGVVHGARAALAVMRRQGHGVLIDVASALGGRITAPYMSGYAMSKAAVVAFDEVLHEELALLGERHVLVRTVLPGGVDTPFFRHAADLSGRGLRSLPPVATPERVARAIVRTARRPGRRVVLVGPYARPLAVGRRLAPGLVRRAVARRTDGSYLADGAEAGPATSGVLWAPSGRSAAAHGGRHGGLRTAARRAAGTAALLAASRAVLPRRRRTGRLRVEHAPQG